MRHVLQSTCKLYYSTYTVIVCNVAQLSYFNGYILEDSYEPLKIIKSINNFILKIETIGTYR